MDDGVGQFWFGAIIVAKKSGSTDVSFLLTVPYLSPLFQNKWQFEDKHVAATRVCDLPVGVLMSTMKTEQKHYTVAVFEVL